MVFYFPFILQKKLLNLAFIRFDAETFQPVRNQQGQCIPVKVGKFSLIYFHCWSL